MFKNTAILTIKDKELPIRLNVDKLFVLRVPEMIDITGETDEEYHSRRNTFFSWLLGLPKRRRQSTYVPGRRPMPEPLLISVDPKHVPFFKAWIVDNSPNKINCGLKVMGILGNIILHGTFPNEISTNGNISLMYDTLTQNEKTSVV